LALGVNFVHSLAGDALLGSFATPLADACDDFSEHRATRRRLDCRASASMATN
jgi:hypothetical protein